MQRNFVKFEKPQSNRMYFPYFSQRNFHLLIQRKSIINNEMYITTIMKKKSSKQNMKGKVKTPIRLCFFSIFFVSNATLVSQLHIGSSLKTNSQGVVY